MGQARLSIPVPEPLPGDAGVADAGVDQLTVIFLDANGDPIAPPVALEAPETIFIEGRGPEAGLTWAPVTPPTSFEVDVPPETTSIRVSRGGNVEEFAIGDVTEPSPRPPDARRSFPEADRRWTLAVVAERFSDAEAFFDHAAALHALISEQAPFSDPEVSFGIEALFWASDDFSGLFGATDDRVADRVLQGDGERVKRFVRKADLDPQKILVIVNSGLRAGAGGQGRTIPSWTTVTGAPGERWEGIAIHELGHAFGLADEYDTSVNLREPDPLEPNVSREADPARTSWHLLATATAPPSPTALRGQEAGHGAEEVGTFQGARYRPDDRFRPSPICRMRVTPASFCPVCRDHIRRELLA